jgi:hypothetical protein
MRTYVPFIDLGIIAPITGGLKAARRTTVIPLMLIDELSKALLSLLKWEWLNART